MVERLYGKTMTKALDWKQQGDYVFVEIGNRIVKLIEGRSGGDNPLEILEVCDFDGSFIERFTDEDLEGKPDSWTGIEGFWTLMGQTRETAIRQATGADDAIDELLDQLNDSPWSNS
ncbi:MAG: hypothetical protein J7517_09690 [Sphingobium yanoikuyae]|nr:hypothetical protein [Sphingobium yanoikuyae]